MDDGPLLYQYKRRVENLKHEREGLRWTMSRCWIKYKSRAVRKGMQATGGRWPVAVSIQAMGKGDASKQQEENEKQARSGEMQEQNLNSDLCFGKDPVHSEDRRETLVAVSIQAMGGELEGQW